MHMPFDNPPIPHTTWRPARAYGAQDTCKRMTGWPLRQPLGTSTLQASFRRYHRAFSLVRPVALVITHIALYATHRTSASALFGALVTRGDEALWKRDKCAFATLRSCFSLATFLFNSSTSAGVAAESEGRLPLRPP